MRGIEYYIKHSGEYDFKWGEVNNEIFESSMEDLSKALRFKDQQEYNVECEVNPHEVQIKLRDL